MMPSLTTAFTFVWPQAFAASVRLIVPSASPFPSRTVAVIAFSTPD
jgi:hypothetical protein